MRSTKHPQSYEQINASFKYDPVKGRIYRIRRDNTLKDVTHIEGRQIAVFERVVQKSHLVHLLKTGEWPEVSCRFLDSNASNLKWENLRFGKAVKSDLDVEAVRRLLVYNPIKGTLKWRGNNHRKKAGDPAGYLAKSGKIVVSVFGHQYSAGTLILFMETGTLPDKCSHVDRDGTNLKRNNLFIPKMRPEYKIILLQRENERLQCLANALTRELEQHDGQAAFKILSEYHVNNAS